MTERVARRALGGLLAILAAGAAAAPAQDRVSAGFALHTDDDGLVVHHPSVSASAEVVDGTRARAAWEMDAISAATVDVRTGASPRGFDETRHGLSAGVEQRLGAALAAGAAYATSLSPDHVAHRGTIAVSVEDAEQTRELTLGASVSRELVGRAGDREWTGTVTAVGADVAFTTLLSPELVVDLSAAFELRTGYLESPYRFVPILGGAGQRLTALPEAVPDVRRRAAGRIRLRWAFAPDLFATAAWRVHADDWGIAGHTVEARLARAFGPDVTLGVLARFYGQRSASFYRGEYFAIADLPVWRTLDRELAAAAHAGAGLWLQWRFLQWMRLDARAELTRQRYFDTPRLPERTALTVGLALTWEP